MSTASDSTAQDPQVPTSQWKGLDNPESEQFVEDAIALLRNPTMVEQFHDNVKQAGTWANDVDRAFDRVTRTFDDIVNRFGGAFPQLRVFLVEWKALNQRWIDYLLASRNIASQHIVILRRFDMIFLDMVMHIVTEQDRLEVIEELQHFIEEDHQASGELSRHFVELKRDVDAFTDGLDRYAQDMGVVLETAAGPVIAEIRSLQKQITVVDQQIADAQLALAIAGALLNIIGLIVAGSLLAQFQRDRDALASRLWTNQRELEDINRRQEALAYLQTVFAGLRPDIDLICDRLRSFAEIWLSVQSQAIQFQFHIQGSLGAVGNLRFRAEVTLAREVARPLQVGLERYAAELGGRLATKGYDIQDTLQADLAKVDEEIAAWEKKKAEALATREGSGLAAANIN